MQQMQLSLGRSLKMPENVSKLQNPKMGRPQHNVKNLNGQKFGRLLIIGYAGVIEGNTPKDKNSYWLAQCECGNYLITKAHGLLNSTTQSCGCYNRDRTIETHTKHGQSNTPEYRIFFDAKCRCTNPNNKAAFNYHDRGIEFRFASFEEFMQTIGKRPTPRHTLDRIDNNGHYEPGNVRWATRTQQSRNTRRTRFLTIGKETKCIAEWAGIVGIKHSIIRNRKRRGWCDTCSVMNPAEVRCAHIPLITKSDTPQ